MKTLRTLVVAIVALVSTSAMAQGIIVNQNDGTSTAVNANDLKNITFTDEAVQTTSYVSKEEVQDISNNIFQEVIPRIDNNGLRIDQLEDQVMTLKNENEMKNTQIRDLQNDIRDLKEQIRELENYVSKLLQ